MLRFSDLLVWVCTVTNALAFYPRYPLWKCVEDSKCVAGGGDRRSLEESKVIDSSASSTWKKARANGLSDHVESLNKKFEKIKFSHVKRKNSFSIVPAIQPTQANSVALNQDGSDFSYFAQVKLGASGKSFLMLMDTGASNTWVMGLSCSTTACQAHDLFAPSDSKTYQASDKQFNISYGSGVVTGTYATDNVSLGGFSLSLTFGVANDTSDDFLHFPFDGIIGLADYPSEFPTFLDVLRSSKVLKSTIFGVHIDRAVDGEHDGEINFGKPDDSKYIGNLSYVPLSDSGWKIAVDGVGFNGKSAGLTGKYAYIDTGTSYSFLPPGDAKALHELIPGSQLGADGITWHVPCTTTSPVQFTFSGVTYNVSSKDWIGGKTDSLCASNIYSGSPLGPTWLLGDIFLKNVYAVFDADQKRIGFGKQTSVTVSTSISTTTSTATASISGSSYGITSALATTSGNSGSSLGFNAITTSSPSPQPVTAATSASGGTIERANIVYIAIILATIGGVI